MKTITFILLSILISGCSAIYTDRDSNKANIAGAGSIFYEPKVFSLGNASDSFGTINYCQLLKNYGFSADNGVSKTECNINPEKLNNENFGSLRNEVQDRILASSNQKCGEYMRALFAQKGDTEVFWGSLATLFSGAGAVISHMPTAQAFSAGGAVFSGVDSEFQQAYFANKAIEVITAGINARRAEILEDIVSRRIQHNIYNKQVNNLVKTVEKQPSDENAESSALKPSQTNISPKNKVNQPNINALHYSLNASIRDAVLYHSACTTVVGLEVAAESIARVKNPGITEVSNYIKKLKESELLKK